jgi:hypothetical protein
MLCQPKEGNINQHSKNDNLKSSLTKINPNVA